MHLKTSYGKKEIKVISQNKVTEANVNDINRVNVKLGGNDVLEALMTDEMDALVAHNNIYVQDLPQVVDEMVRHTAHNRRKKRTNTRKKKEIIKAIHHKLKKEKSKKV